MTTENIASRRKFLGGMGLAATSSVIPIQELLGRSQSRTSRLSFDWSKPEDNLTAFVKVMGDLDGSPRFWSAQGTIYARRPGHMTIPIVKVEGARWSRFDQIENGYKMWTRDWVIFRDLQTGDVLENYENPFTGRTNQVKQILTRAYNWEMTPETGQRMAGYTGEGWLIGKPLIMPWVEEGNHVAVTLELLVKYANGVVGSELEHFLVEADELYNPNLTSTSGRQAWVGNSPWLRWMEMKDEPGGTQWHSSGLKHKSFNSLRPQFRKDIDRFYPGSLENPENYIKPDS